MYSNDGNKMIRVTHHEYSIYNGRPNFHFHYYEIGPETGINNRIPLDLHDPANPLAFATEDYVKDLLIPMQEIVNSPVIKILD